MTLIVENLRLLQDIDPSAIPSLIQFPLRKIYELYPDHWGFLYNDRWEPLYRATIWDMGFGPSKNFRSLKNSGFTIGGYEANVKAVEIARTRRDFFGTYGDVRYWGSGEFGASDILGRLESAADVMLAEAVFPSLIGDDWKSALDAWDMGLIPGGRICVADFMDASQLYPDLYSRKDLLTQRVWEESASKWKRRYEVNAHAFHDLNLPYGTFAVFEPGSHKFELDWSEDPDLIRFFYDKRSQIAGGFERLARHLDIQEFTDYLVKLGYDIEYLELVPRKSRGFNSKQRWSISPGFNLIARKGNIFKYSPWKMGLDVHDSDLFDKIRARKGDKERLTYWDDYFDILMPVVPISQKEIFLQYAKKLTINKW